MFVRPQALLEKLTPFNPIEIDYVNAVTAYRWEEGKPKSSWTKLKQKIRPSKFTLDLGQIITPVLKAAGIDYSLSDVAKIDWNFETQSKVSEGIELDQATFSSQFSKALEIQDKCLQTNYFHNVQFPQTLSKNDARLLEAPLQSPNPLLSNPPSHGDILVIDALLVLQDKEGEVVRSFITDYPPFILKKNDAVIDLRLSDQVKRNLKEYIGPLGWHPFCRILGAYKSMGEKTPIIEPLLISLRNFGTVHDSIAQTLKDEWETLKRSIIDQTVIRESAYNDIVLSLASRASDLAKEGIKDVTYKAIVKESWHHYKQELGNSIEEVRAFEDDIFTGALSYLISLYYFKQTAGKDKYELICREIANKLDFELSYWFKDLPPSNNRDSEGTRWRKSSEVFEPYDVIRIDEIQLDKLLSIISGAKDS